MTVDQAKVVAYHPALTYKKGAHVLCGTTWYEALVDAAPGADLMPEAYHPGSWSHLGKHVDVRTFDGDESPEPSCDAPHCDCVEGEDCRANVAGGTYEDGEGRRRQLTAAVPDPLPTHDQWLATLRPAGPVFTMALVDRRMTIFADGKPAPDHPWQQAFDAQQHEADRVMVRAVSPAYPGPDDDRDTWALNPDATGHRAPFSPGDLVVRSSGRAGIHRVVEVSPDVDAPRHRSLRLTVEPTDVVVDRDAF